MRVDVLGKMPIFDDQSLILHTGDLRGQRRSEDSLRLINNIYIAVDHMVPTQCITMTH